jgi:hypothetical protein
VTWKKKSLTGFVPNTHASSPGVEIGQNDTSTSASSPFRECG